MIAAWMLYALLVGVLAGAGALVVDNLLRAHRLSTRWIWAGAMALTLFWPFGHILVKNWPREGTPIPLPDPSRIAVLDPLAVQVTPESFLRSLDQPILILWALSSAVLFVLFGTLLLRTRRLRKSWKGERAAGQPVLISQDEGPAVIGFVRPQIVLPSWCKELEEQTLRLILDHETEHLKAGDLRLILSAGSLTILFPWHLPLWWQLQRLRVAVEGDCDLRVLRKYPERTRPYLELLLQVGSRSQRGQALAAMLSEPEETLERRIRIMTMPFPRKPWIRGVALTAFGGLLVAVAGLTPSPTDIRLSQAELSAVELPPPPGSGLTQGSAPGESGIFQAQQEKPRFTPFTTAPEITNRSDVVVALEKEYPPQLREAGIGGTVTVWFNLDDTGRVLRVQVDKSSGHKALDDAALRVASGIEFTPALNEDKKVPVWISLPITFVTDGEIKAIETPPDPEDIRERIDVRNQTSAGEEISAAPSFTPYTVAPEIKNRGDVARALGSAYPPLLRDAGIGGTTHIWFFVDENGVVRRTSVDKSSGHKALDEAALQVASVIEFSPALNRDKPVPVWISLPITFTTR